MSYFLLDISLKRLHNGGLGFPSFTSVDGDKTVTQGELLFHCRELEEWTFKIFLYAAIRL